MTNEEALKKAFELWPDEPAMDGGYELSKYHLSIDLIGGGEKDHFIITEHCFFKDEQEEVIAWGHSWEEAFESAIEELRLREKNITEFGLNYSFGGIVILKLADGEPIPEGGMDVAMVQENTVKCGWGLKNNVIGTVHPATFGEPITPTLVYVSVVSFAGSRQARKFVTVEGF